MCPRCHGLGRETCGPPLLCRPGPLSPGSGLPPRAGQARENSPRPARPARRSRKRRGRGPEGRPRGHPPTIPPTPANLEVVAAEVHAAHERQHPGGLHGGAALRQAGRTPGGREPRAGSAPAPPLQPARASSRPRPLREGRRGGSGSSRPRPAQTSRELGDRRSLRESGTPAGGVHHLRSPVAASRVGSRQCRLGGCSLGSGP